jgi:hypothetical protein
MTVHRWVPESPFFCDNCGTQTHDFDGALMAAYQPCEPRARCNRPLYRGQLAAMLRSAMLGSSNNPAVVLLEELENETARP